MMRSEQIKNVLSATAIDFIEGEAKKRQVFLYKEDVEADGVEPLKDGMAIRVTFDYVNLADI
jgi:cold shock CspA family protein